MYLQVRHLSKSYSGRRVVSDIDLNLKKGEILSVLGPSGCGKTTLLRMLVGLVSPDSGWIQVEDQVMYDGKRETPIEERQMGMVFQDYALWPHLNVSQNIAFGMRLQRFPATQISKRVGELLELVNLNGLAERYPYQLSGGQQQRVAMARALATSPRILLLDEPLSNLDTALRESMRIEIVNLLRQLNVTTVNVTHDQNEAMAMSDQIMVLRDGSLQQLGTPTELYFSPANSFVASFMGAANLLVGNLESRSRWANFRLSEIKTPSCLLANSSTLEASYNPDQKVLLLCRPDDIKLHPQAVELAHPNVLRGHVVQTSFVAGRWRTQVKISDSQTITLAVFSTIPTATNQTVWLELPPEQCRIVPAT